MSTPHNSAVKGDIAEVVLMPGDPLRAKYIAETFLEDAVCFNTVRNMFGYTGTYKGKKVSVMGSGMGQPSIGIYSHELYADYGVKSIIRIGSAGAYVKECALYDTVLATGAYSQSTFAKVGFGYEEDIQYPNKDLNDRLISAAKRIGVELKEGIIHSSDVFYNHTDFDYKALVDEKNVVAVEMESFALFANARYLGKEAACLLTISDSFVTEELTTALERQNSFTNMMKVALESLFE